MTEAEIIVSLNHARSELEQLRHQVAALETRTNLISPSFLKRAFAVYGHQVVAHLIIMVPLLILMFIIAFVVAMVSSH